MSHLDLSRHARQLPGWLVLALWALVVALPLYILVISCFKTTGEIYGDKFGLPTRWTLDNFTNAWREAHFARYMLNSFAVTGGSVIVTLLVASMAAFPLSRYPLGWSSPMLAFFLAGVMLPIRLASVELFTLMKTLDLLDSRVGLIAVYTAIRIPFAVFILANFMRVLPKELEEAARLDGASEWKILFLIILPTIRPGVAIVAIFTAIAVWNDFFFPLIFIFDDDYKTVPLAITTFIGQFRTDWGMVFAALTLSMMPVVIMYLLLARQIREGVGATGGLK
jgi:raffinose/stachyose/melibiose transport system permease protein